MSKPSQLKTKPQLHGVRIDKLSLTIAAKRKPKLERRLEDLRDHPRAFPRSKSRYDLSVKLSVPVSKHAVVLEAFPMNQGHNLIRLEFNPSLLGVKGVGWLARFLGKVLGDQFPAVSRNSTVTRLDVAADFSHVAVADILVRPSRLRRSGMFFDARGNPQTLYFGDVRGSRRLAVYDKKAWAKAMGKEVPPHDLTRVEARLCPRVPLSDLATINNPFVGIEVYSLAALEADPDFPGAVLDSIRYRGVGGFLGQLESSERAEYRKAMDGARCRWLNPKRVWGQWGRALTVLGALNPTTDRPIPS